MAPSRTATQWLGMTLTILESGTYVFSLSMVSPATRLRTVVPSCILVPSSTNTWGTCFGLTARTASFVSAATSEAVANMRIPYVWHMWSRVPWLGAHAMISSFV